MSQIHPLTRQPLPSGWRVFSVDELKSNEKNACVAGPFGSSISSKYFVEEGVPVIRGGNLTAGIKRFVPDAFVYVSEERAEKYSAQHVVKDDLVFTCWGSVGHIGIIPEDGPFDEYIISNKQLKLRVNEDLVRPLYAYLYFSSRLGIDYVKSHAKGAAVPGISLGILKGLEVAVPPLSAQDRIVSLVSAYDDLIENNTRRIEILEEMARRLYEEWFVHFRFPGHEVVSFKESELGEIPEGWKIANLEEVVNLTMGQSPKSEFYNDRGEGLPFHQGVTDFGNYFPSNRLYCTVENRIAEEGDILFSVRAPVGRINISKEKIVIGRGVSALRSKSGHQVFLLSQLRKIFEEEDSIGNGAIFKAVTKKDMQTIKLLQPDSRYIEGFESIAGSLWKQIRVLSDKNNNLRAQRDLLLPKLVSGEIDVSDIPMPNNKEIEAA